MTLALRYIFVRSNYVWKWRENYASFLFVIVTYFLFCHNYVIYLFHVNTFFDDVGNSFYFCTFKLRMEITLQLRFGFVRHCSVFLLRHNYVICWFHIVTFFDDVRITLYFGTFELCMEITLQLRFVFVLHFNVFFITLQLRYLFVQCSYIFWWC